MTRRATYCLTLALASSQLFSCATIMNSATTRVKIRSEPDEIKVSTMNAGKRVECVTDCILTLNNNEDHVLRFEDPKVLSTERTLTSSVTGWFWVNLVWGGTGLIFMAVDWLTDNMHTLWPEEVFVEFINEEDEEDEEDDDESSPDDYEEEESSEAVADSAGNESQTAPRPALETVPTGVAALPAVTVEDRIQIERVVPPARMEEAIRQYYGEVDAARSARIRERLYKIMQHQRATSGEADLDQAIAMEIHDSLL